MKTPHLTRHGVCNLLNDEHNLKEIADMFKVSVKTLIEDMKEMGFTFKVKGGIRRTIHAPKYWKEKV